MNDLHTFALIYLIGINIIAFATYGIDKKKAKHHKWRIPESTLLFLAVIGGSIGAWLGMQKFHHKTRKKQFAIGIPFIFLLQAAMLFALFYYKVL